MLMEAYKSVNQLGPKLSWNNFVFLPTKYNLRRGNQVKLPFPHNTICTNSFDFRAGVAWNQLSIKIKSIETLKGFKREIQNIEILCMCKLCSVS